MADPFPEETNVEERAIEGYIDKIDTIALLLLGGVKPEALKEWYDISDDEIEQAQEKIAKLGIQKEVRTVE